jgi:hypothetical protein
MIEQIFDYNKDEFNWVSITETKCFAPGTITGIISGTAPTRPGVYEIPFSIKDETGTVVYQTAYVTVTM